MNKWYSDNDSEMKSDAKSGRMNQRRDDINIVTWSSSGSDSRIS